MNPAQSFYGYENWHYPSPSSTPTSAKKELFTFSDTYNQPAHVCLSAGSNSYQGYPVHETPAYQERPDYTRQTIPPHAHTSAMSRPQLRNQGNKRQVNPGQSLTNSFLEAFDTTSLQDPSRGWGNMDQFGQTPGQMQTPPPTRDSGKRKPQQPQLQFTTPSTIKSRRQSAPGDAWLKRTSDQSPLEETSPLQFTPLQFSPPGTHAFTQSGAATAPAYPQNDIFWDPSAQSDFDFAASFPAGHDDPFLTTVSQIQTQAGQAMASKHQPMVPAPTRGHHHALLSQPRRPQSARPATASEPRISHRPMLGTSGVDPTMLWSNSSNDTNRERLNISNPAASQGSAGLPYQYHFDESQREREELRQQRISSRRAHLVSSTGASGLRRSLTDSRSRKSFRDQRGIIAGGDTIRGLQDPQISRHASPLKRQRTSTQSSISSNSASSVKKSVVLEIDDETGRARAVVKPVPGESGVLHQPQEEVGFALEDSETEEAPSSRNEAQDALREMVRDRHSRRQGGFAISERQESLGGGRVAESSPLDDVSPSTDGTIPDPTIHMPFGARAFDFNQNTRCVCGNNVANNLMIQCESCKSWSHTSCLGLNGTQMPPVYVCMFCSGGLPTGAGGGQRGQPNYSHYSQGAMHQHY